VALACLGEDPAKFASLRQNLIKVPLALRTGRENRLRPPQRAPHAENAGFQLSESTARHEAAEGHGLPLCIRKQTGLAIKCKNL
jgi:hypothetical protein